MLQQPLWMQSNANTIIIIIISYCYHVQLSWKRKENAQLNFEYVGNHGTENVNGILALRRSFVLRYFITTHPVVLPGDQSSPGGQVTSLQPSRLCTTHARHTEEMAESKGGTSIEKVYKDHGVDDDHQ